MTEFRWADFARVTAGSPHWALLERAEGMAGQPGNALDLGCGAGRDTRYLLVQGWRVTAVDSEPAAIATLADLPVDRLETAQSTIEDFPFEREKYDLVNAQFSLPFIQRERFDDTFAQIKAALRPGGLFAGQFFGVRDEWNTSDSHMTFVTKEEAAELLSDMEVIELREEERDGTTALGGTKHWHVFHLLAKKG